MPPGARRRWNVVERAGKREREGGQALVETVLVLPLLLTLVLAIIDAGITWSHYEALTEAVRVGGRAQVVSRFTGTPDPMTAFMNAATNVPGAAGSGGRCSTAGADASFTGTAPYSIRLFGFSVLSGTMTSTVTGRCE